METSNIKDLHVKGDTSVGSSSNTRDERKAREKAKEKALAMSMCRQALNHTLGQYMLHRMRLPVIKQTLDGQTHERNLAYPLSDLEEALVPYYSVLSKSDYYCRLII